VIGVGDEQRLWVIVPQESRQVTNYRVLARDIGPKSSWSEIATLDREPVSITTRGGQGLLLFPDGTWTIAFAGGQSSGPPLPDRRSLLALASHGDSVVGLGSSAAEASRSSPGSSPTSAAVESLPTGPAIFALRRGNWEYRAAVPPDFLVNERPFLACDEDEIVLFQVNGRLVYGWRLDGAEWTSFPPIELPDPPAAVSVLRMEGQWVIWTRGEGDFGAWRAYEGKSWGQPISIQLPLTGIEPKPGWLAVAGGVPRYIAPVGDRIHEFALRPDGSAKDAPAEIRAASVPPREEFPSWISIGLMTLLLLVIAGSMRSRGQIMEPGLLGVLPRLAPNGRRAIAGLIDAWPILAFFVVAVVVLRGEGWEQTPAVNEKLSIWSYLAVGVYVLHTLLSELLTGKSLGKKLTGLRVEMLNGGPVTPGAVIVRNLMRILDVAMIAPILLVLFSPLRQRVGDFAAGTVVTTGTPPPAPPAGPPEHPQAGA
jgi:uncharacterized RDD family membrane protein YckC